MMDKPEECIGCPLYDYPMVPPTGELGNIAIVGEAPGQQEVNKGVPFVGLSGQLLRRVLEDVGIDGPFWITNSCLCRPPKNAAPPDEAIHRCNDRLMAELTACSRILTLGATALQAVYGPASIQSMRGQRLWIDEAGAYCIPTYHPAALLRNPDLFTDFYTDLKMFKLCPSEEQPPEAPPSYEVIATKEQLVTFAKSMAKAEPTAVAVDIETTGLDEFVDDILCIGIAYDEAPDWARISNNAELKIGIIPVSELDVDDPLFDILEELLTDDYYFWVGHNAASFDCKFIRNQLGIDWRPKMDTMLAHYTVDERKGSHSLKLLAREYFAATDYDAPLKGAKGHLERVEKNLLYQYLAYDVYYTHRLVAVLKDEMDVEETRHIHDQILLPAALALGEIEHTGVLLDQEHLRKLEKEYTADLEKLVADIREYLGDEKFNPNSPKQVAHHLYERLKLRKGGSTNKEALEEIDHPVARMMLEYRQKGKLLSTYVRGLLERVGEDGRIHADFLLHGTVTGRLSSRNPNLQNIPARSGVIIRDAFIASPGWRLIEADYSQLELRVAAYYSGDPILTETFATGGDIHTEVACQIFNKEPEDITKDERYAAKFVDFGILYGRGAKSLAEGELNCSVKKAQRYLDNFLARFQGMHRWMLHNQKLAIEQGYVESAFGRKRRFPLVLSMNKHEIQRQAINAPIQSAASDICLSALIRLHRKFNPDIARILLTVHDSILIEVKEGYEDEMMQMMYEEMVEKAPIEAKFKFDIECKVGTSWGSLHKKKFSFSTVSK